MIFPDQIDCSISSETEPDATEFSDTLDVLDNTLKNVKYQKIKNILLEDIKIDMADLIQNEIRQKINLYSQDEHQTQHLKFASAVAKCRDFCRGISPFYSLCLGNKNAKAVKFL